MPPHRASCSLLLSPSHHPPILAFSFPSSFLSHLPPLCYWWSFARWPDVFPMRSCIFFYFLKWLLRTDAPGSLPWQTALLLLSFWSEAGEGSIREDKGENGIWRMGGIKCRLFGKAGRVGFSCFSSLVQLADVSLSAFLLKFELPFSDPVWCSHCFCLRSYSMACQHCKFQSIFCLLPGFTASSPVYS